jgi:hypothetical protein
MSSTACAESTPGTGTEGRTHSMASVRRAERSSNLRLVDAPPRGLRWREESPVSAQLRPRISRFYFCLFCAVWNFALGPGHVIEALGLPLHRRPTVGYDLVGLLGVVFFVILAVRELALTTRVDFRGGQLVVRAPLAPWVRFDAPMSEIVSFYVVPKEDGTHQVALYTRTGPDPILPLGFETVPTRASWTRKRPFASPPAYATFLAGRLGEMLETARRSGHDTYRT